MAIPGARGNTGGEAPGLVQWAPEGEHRCTKRAGREGQRSAVAAKSKAMRMSSTAVDRSVDCNMYEAGGVHPTPCLPDDWESCTGGACLQLLVALVVWHSSPSSDECICPIITLLPRCSGTLALRLLGPKPALFLHFLDSPTIVTSLGRYCRFLSTS